MAGRVDRLPNKCVAATLGPPTDGSGQPCRYTPLSIINFISVALIARSMTREMTPAPLVPEMPTSTTETEETRPTADGGERRALPERTFGAPLVPDYR